MWIRLPGVILCGKRGTYSYDTGNLTSLEKDFECPSGWVACSKNIIINSTTYCVPDGSDDCPVTDLQLLDIESKSPILKDPSYKKFLSPQNTSPNSNSATRYYIAFTKNGYRESNTPLQSLQWEYGQPCAFTD